MRKSRQAGLEPSLSQKVESKLLITKQTSTLSTHMLAKLDHFRHEETLQREYNLKFMTDRKRTSNQKSQKSLSSSKATHKEPRARQNPVHQIQPQRLVFDSMDYRSKYYELHDEYINERRKNMERSEQALALREALGSFLSSFDSRSAEEVCGLVEGEKVREAVRRAVEGRRRAEAGEGVLREAMRILQVDSWEELVHNLRARVERFRTLDECTFKILELEAINKRVVNDFEERLQRIREDQEEEWERERQMKEEELKGLEQALDGSEREKQALRAQFQATLTDLVQLASEQPTPHLLSGRSEVHELQRLVAVLRSRLQEIEVEAEENMFKLLKSNEEMLRLERSIGQLRGEMELQIEELEEKNEQNLCEVRHLQAQLEQQEQELARGGQEAARKEAERLRAVRQVEDERALMASALAVTDCHPAKLLLAIKEQQEQAEKVGRECEELRAAVGEKDRLSLELQAQVARWGRAAQQAQEAGKTALFEKEEYKFLLNNLRDQFSEVKRQHQEELARTIHRKDQEIVASNHDILESHAALTDQLAGLRADHTKLTLEHEEARAGLAHFKGRAEQGQRLLVEKEGVVKRLSAEGERYRVALRELESSFRDAIELEELNTKQIAALEAEKVENALTVANYTQRNAELGKANEELSRERNKFKTELSVALNDVKELKDLRGKLQATNVELRLEGLNKTSEITKLEERLKNAESEGRVLKAGNDKLMGEVNSVTRKLIAAKSEIKRRVTLKLKEFMPKVREFRAENETLKVLVKAQLSWGISEIAKAFACCLTDFKESQNEGEAVQILAETAEAECQSAVDTAEGEAQSHVAVAESESQCDIIPSDLRESVLNRLTLVLTSLSLLRSQKNEVDEALLSLQAFSLEDVFRVLEDPIESRLRQIQGSISMIREDSLEEQESELRDAAKIITPDEIFQLRTEAQDVNLVLQALLEDDEVPSVPYWEKIEANFLALRRRLTRRGNFRLDISAIDFRDPTPNSPHSSTHEVDLFRRMATDPDESVENHRETITNRSERFGGVQAVRRENEQLRLRLQELLGRLSESQEELQALRGKVVQLENETSIVGLEHNFKKVLDYLLNDNADLFLQTCRILMKMLHFADIEIKDFEEQLQNKRKRKKSGLFAGLFKV